MEDDSKLGSHRFVRIDVTDPECVRRWAEQFQVSEAEVREAGDRVGPYAGAVQVYLARR